MDHFKLGFDEKKPRTVLNDLREFSFYSSFNPLSDQINKVKFYRSLTEEEREFIQNKYDVNFNVNAMEFIDYFLNYSKSFGIDIFAKQIELSNLILSMSPIEKKYVGRKLAKKVQNDQNYIPLTDEIGKFLDLRTKKRVNNPAENLSLFRTLRKMKKNFDGYINNLIIKNPDSKEKYDQLRKAIHTLVSDDYINYYFKDIKNKRLLAIYNYDIINHMYSMIKTKMKIDNLPKYYRDKFGPRINKLIFPTINHVKFYKEVGLPENEKNELHFGSEIILRNLNQEHPENLSQDTTDQDEARFNSILKKQETIVDINQQKQEDTLNSQTENQKKNDLKKKITQEEVLEKRNSIYLKGNKNPEFLEGIKEIENDLKKNKQQVKESNSMKKDRNISKNRSTKTRNNKSNDPMIFDFKNDSIDLFDGTEKERISLSVSKKRQSKKKITLNYKYSQYENKVSSYEKYDDKGNLIIDPKLDFELKKQIDDLEFSFNNFYTNLRKFEGNKIVKDVKFENQKQAIRERLHKIVERTFPNADTSFLLKLYEKIEDSFKSLKYVNSSFEEKEFKLQEIAEDLIARELEYLDKAKNIKHFFDLLENQFVYF